MNEDNEFGWMNNRVVYSLSFILIIWELKGFIISLFPNTFSINFYNLPFTPTRILDSMLLLLLISLYLYGFNYLIKDPLSKTKKYLNSIASFLWFLFLFFPFFMAILFIFQLAVNSKGIVLSVAIFLFCLFAELISSRYLKKDREIELLKLDKQIEAIKIAPKSQDNVAEFLKHYIILESLIKRTIVEKMKISIDPNKSIHLIGATNMLLADNLIDSNTKISLDKLWELRNKVVHEEEKVSEKEIEKVRDAIRDLDYNIKTKNKMK